MRPLPLLVLIAAVLFAGASLVTPFNGAVGTDLPVPQVDPPVQPAGWAFAIWGIIYLWLILGAAYGLWRRAADPAWDRARGPLLASLVLGIPWLWIALRSTPVAVAWIVAMAAFAVWAWLRAPAEDRGWLRGPIGLYAGWLTAATGVSLGILAAGYGLLPPLGAAFAAVLLALVVAVAVQRQRPGAWTYGAAVAWALLGLTVRSLGTYPGLAALCALGIVAILWVALRHPRPRVTPRGAS